MPISEAATRPPHGAPVTMLVPPSRCAPSAARGVRERRCASVTAKASAAAKARAARSSSFAHGFAHGFAVRAGRDVYGAALQARGARDGTAGGHVRERRTQRISEWSNGGRR